MKVDKNVGDLGRIPKDERGEPMYEEVDAGTAWDAILEQTEGDEGMAEMVVDSMIGDKIKELDGLRKKGIMSGGTIAEKIAAEKKLRGEIEGAQRVLGHWQEIKNQKGWKEGVSDEGKGEVANDEATNANKGKSKGKSEVKGVSEGEVLKGEEKGNAEEEKELEEKNPTEEKPTEVKTEDKGKVVDGKASDEEEGVITDSQGNPINEDGTLKLEELTSVDELTDEDFSNPTRNVQLPKIPENVDRAIGANGKPIVIKKNIFEKNWSAHKFPFDESRAILKAALYDTDLVGQTQPSKRPLHWVAIKVDDKSPLVVLEVNEGKDNVELVGWYTLDARNLDRIKRQAKKNGGELVMLSAKDKVESLSTPHDGLSSDDKGTKNGDGVQGKVEEKISEADAEDVKRVIFERLQKAVRGLAYALKGGEGKEEAISELKRVVKENDRGEAAKNFLYSYWQLDRYIKGDGDKVSKEHALILDVLGYLRDALVENGVVVMDGVRGVKVGDMVCYKAKDFKDAKGYYEKVGRVASVDRGSVVMDDGTKVGKRSVLGYCRVVDEAKAKGDGVSSAKVEEKVKVDAAHEEDTPKVDTPKVEEKAKTNVENGKADGGKSKKGGKSEKSKVGDGVAMGNGTTDGQGNPLNGDGTKRGDGVRGEEVKELSAEEMRVFSERLMGAVNGVFKAIKGGDERGKVEAIEGLKRVVGEMDKWVAAEAFLDNYWHTDNLIKKVGEDAKKKMGAVWSETLGTLRGVMVENGFGVMDGSRGIKVGDMVCYKIEIPEEERYDNLEYVIATDRVSEVNRGGVVLSNGGEVKKGNVLGYCRVGVMA